LFHSIGNSYSNSKKNILFTMSQLSSSLLNSQRRLVSLLLLLLATTTICQAWVLSPSSRIPMSRQQQVTLSSTTLANANDALSVPEEEEEEEEYEYIEYELLTEPEYMGSEWLVGTVMDNNQAKIAETWVRLAADNKGKNIAIWGDNAQGTWSLDVANQFLSISKENLIGKKIWAGVVEDYYFTAGTVRGWSFVTSAAVIGQWQAKRLGVDMEEAGTAPWFEEEEEEEEETTVAEKETSETPVAEEEDRTTVRGGRNE
jgi:hypothetical protein